MAPLCIEEGNDFYCNEEESSTTSTHTSITSTSSLSSASSNESAASPLKTPRGRRSVSFSAGAAVHLGAVMNVEDYSDVEKLDCWYQADEMREIRKDVKDTIALMNQNLPIDKSLVDITMSTRGLEGKTRAGKRYRREVRLASLAAVFDEQTLQEMDGMSDPVMIAIAYTFHTKPMQVAAFERASIFQREADEIYKSSIDMLQYPHGEDDIFSALVETRGCSEDAEVPVGPTKYGFTESQRKEFFGKLLEIEETTEDESNDDESSNAFDEKNVIDDAATRNDVVNDEHTNNIEPKDDLLVEPEHNTNLRPYNMGPLSIRERFACFLPGAVPSTKRNTLIGALRVVQI